MTIMLTGGAGYIGSHTYVALHKAGFYPVIVDNFSNSNRKVIHRLELLTGQPVVLEEGDVSDRKFLEMVMNTHDISGVIHFAALKSVEKSNENPLLYYRHNVGAILTLLEVMQSVQCQKLVYSSSATVYGNPDTVPETENLPLQHESAYAHTKIISEEMISYVEKTHPNFTSAILRYFNPTGAHESGLIGEDPKGTPDNLMPLLGQVATGKRPSLNIYGTDYNTPDGTGIRDYVHVMDLAEGHVAALQWLINNSKKMVVNLGSGRGFSVREVISAFEKASGRKIPNTSAPRRSGDVPCFYADTTRAQQLFGWEARRGLDAMCTDSWRWQSMNPLGYEG